MVSPKKIGEKSEGQVLAAFLRADKQVLTPFGDSARYDLVVDEDGDFIRVQAKTGKVKDGAIVFKTCSVDWYGKTRRSYRGEADVFAVYVQESDDLYIVPVDGLPVTEARLRLAATKNGQTKGVRMANPFIFDPIKSLRDYALL